jgi:hypothetical protein
LLLSLLAVAGTGLVEEAGSPGEAPASEEPAPPLEGPVTLETPVSVEALAARLEALERIVLGVRAGEDGGSPALGLPGPDPTRRLAELERRLQRVELGASSPAGGLGQVESRLRQVESRLSRVESDVRAIRR